MPHENVEGDTNDSNEVDPTAPRPGFECGVCSDFTGTLADLEDHISDDHGLWWGAYEQRHADFTCRSCGQDLDEPQYYCSDACRDKDTNPPNPCPWCDETLPHDVAPASEAHDCPEGPPEPATDTASAQADTSESEASGDSQSDDLGDTLVETDTVSETFDFDEEDADPAEQPPPGEAEKPDYPLLSADDGHVDFEVSLGSTYDVEANFICDECNDFSSDDISVLREHVESDSDLTWSEYLDEHPLHRCAHCDTVLTDIGQKYCDVCDEDPEVDTTGDKVPCQFCGETWVRVDDPFCSAECAAGCLGYGAPLQPPDNPDDTYLESPLRTTDGLPGSSPLIATYRFVCRHCYQYGSDELHGLATHVGKGHELDWAQYIHDFHLRECRTCKSPLYSLTTRYCDMKCQRDDPDPVDTCIGCGGPVDIGNIFCSQACFYENQDVLRT